MFPTKDLSDSQALRLQHILENEFSELQQDTTPKASSRLSSQILGESEEERAKQVIVSKRDVLITL